jgi:hypothetical protein
MARDVTRLTPFETAEARWYLGDLSAVMLQRVAWAAQAEGHDGPAIRELAAYEWTTQDVGDLAARMFAETERPALTRRQAGRRLARDLAAALVSGAMDPAACAHQAHRLWATTDEPDDLTPLAMLSYAYDELADADDADRAAGEEEALSALARAEAERLLGAPADG